MPTVMRLAALAIVTGLAGPALQPVVAQDVPLPTLPRLRAGALLPMAPPLAVGGGAVVLDVMVNPSGSVIAAAPAVSTPPFTDLVAESVKRWRFDPARAVVKGALAPSQGHVLVLAVFRPPQVYNNPTLGEPFAFVGDLSPELPRPGALSMPQEYPPTAVRGTTVLIEIEMSAAAVPRAYRVMSPGSGFDDSALDTVRTWRFDYPSRPVGALSQFVYALVSFREPITVR